MMNEITHYCVAILPDHLFFFSPTILKFIHHMEYLYSAKLMESDIS